MTQERHRQLIVALDGDWDLEGVSRIAGELSGSVGMGKIGKRLFTRFGPDVLRRVSGAGLPVFLDLKYHDIPNTVAGGVAEAVHHGVAMMTLHAAGGREMLLRARAAADQEAQKLGVAAPLLVAVTVLTSLNDQALEEVGVSGGVAGQVERLARLAQDCGIDGVVASPQEVAAVRAACGPDFLVVTPGIRTETNVANDDQARVMTPERAIAAGVSYMVVGRPIYAAGNPADAAREIVSRMESV